MKNIKKSSANPARSPDGHPVHSDSRKSWRFHWQTLLAGRAGTSPWSLPPWQCCLVHRGGSWTLLESFGKIQQDMGSKCAGRCVARPRSQTGMLRISKLATRWSQMHPRHPQVPARGRNLFHEGPTDAKNFYSTLASCKQFPRLASHHRRCPAFGSPVNGLANALAKQTSNSLNSLRNDNPL